MWNILIYNFRIKAKLLYTNLNCMSKYIRLNKMAEVRQKFEEN